MGHVVCLLSVVFHLALTLVLVCLAVTILRPLEEIFTPFGQWKSWSVANLFYKLRWILRTIKLIGESFFLSKNISPHRFCFFIDAKLHFLFLILTNECSILVIVGFMWDKFDQFMTKFKMKWILNHKMPNTVKVLYEYWWPLFFFIVSVKLP